MQGENLLLGKGKMYPKRGIFDGSEECEIENSTDLVIETTNLPPQAHATHAGDSTMAHVHATASPMWCSQRCAHL